MPNTEKLEVDYVGTYENLENDMNYIAHQISEARETLSLPHLKKSKNKNPYNDVYSTKMLDVIGTIYEADFKILDYQR